MTSKAETRCRDRSHTSLTMGDMHNLSLISCTVISCQKAQFSRAVQKVCPHWGGPEHMSQLMCLHLYSHHFPLCLSCTPYLEVIHRVATESGNLCFYRLKDFESLIHSYVFPTLWNAVYLSYQIMSSSREDNTFFFILCLSPMCSKTTPTPANYSINIHCMLH